MNAKACKFIDSSAMWALFHEISLKILQKQKKKIERKHRSMIMSFSSLFHHNPTHYIRNKSIHLKKQETELMTSVSKLN